MAKCNRVPRTPWETCAQLGCCWVLLGSLPAVPGLTKPGLAEGVSARRGATIKDGNLLIQALPALQRESGTVFFTTS